MKVLDAVLTADGFALTALEGKPNMSPDNADTSSLAGSAVWFDLAPSWLLGEVGFAFGAHGRNLQGKAPYDVPLPGAAQGCVDEDAGTMLLRRS